MFKQALNKIIHSSLLKFYILINHASSDFNHEKGKRPWLRNTACKTECLPHTEKADQEDREANK